MTLYIRRPQQHEIVDAEQMVAGAQAHPQGSRPPKPGEWIVTDLNTNQATVMTGDEFAAAYVPLQVPGAMLAPQPGVQPEQQQVGEPPSQQDTAALNPDGTPQANPSYQQPVTEKSVEPFRPMNEAVPGRPIPTPETKPHYGQDPEPIKTQTGQIKEDEGGPEKDNNSKPMSPLMQGKSDTNRPEYPYQHTDDPHPQGDMQSYPAGPPAGSRKESSPLDHPVGPDDKPLMPGESVRMEREGQPQP